MDRVRSKEAGQHNDAVVRRLLIGLLGVLACGGAQDASPTPVTPGLTSAPPPELPPGASEAPLDPGVEAKELALGETFSCALTTQGRVACWGNNQMGQLGQRGTKWSAMPLWVPNLDEVVELKAAAHTACARRADGSVWCWGSNSHGQAGSGTTDAAEPTASAAACTVGEPDNVDWGKVNWQPTQVPNLQGARALALGSYHACALTADGAVECWGDASRQQLATTSGRAFERATISGLPKVRALACRNVSCCTLARDQPGVWCWGNESQRTDTGALDPAPQRVLPNEMRALSLHGSYSCARNASGQYLCWGDLNGCEGIPEESLPAEVPLFRDSIAQVTAPGGCFTCVLDEGGTVRCLGAVDTTEVPNVRQVFAGKMHACAITRDSRVLCWGENHRGETGVPPEQPPPSQ